MKVRARCSLIGSSSRPVLLFCPPAFPVPPEGRTRRQRRVSVEIAAFINPSCGVAANITTNAYDKPPPRSVIIGTALANHF